MDQEGGQKPHLDNIKTKTWLMLVHKPISRWFKDKIILGFPITVLDKTQVTILRPTKIT